MQWELFLGSFIGALAGGTMGIFAIFFLDQWHRTNKNEEISPDSILEKHVEDYIVANFESLFPNWKIYDNASEEELLDENRKPLGRQFKAGRGRIDILCTDPKGHFVVIELKRNRATDKVVTQVDRYIHYIRQNIAEPDQYVKGIIIARNLDTNLHAALSRRKEISAWTFDWSLKLNKRPLTNTDPS